MKSNLGINIGSSSVKIVYLENNQVSWFKNLEHDGNFLETLKNFLKRENFSKETKGFVTGNEGRHLLNLPNEIESLCLEKVLEVKKYQVDAVVSLGGENFVVYTIDSQGKIITSFSGNKCASGTGEFFKQQLGRMDMKLSDLDSISPEAKSYPLSARCSVFMKSDCTHKLNKGEASKDDIVLSLSEVMASKVVDFLKRAKINEGRVLLCGGVSQNKYIVQFIKEKLPHLKILVPEESLYFEAYGAASLAEELGQVLPSLEQLFNPQKNSFGLYSSLKDHKDKVSYLPSQRGEVKENREYILGVDGGSTTTKVALIDIETKEIVAAHYGRTHGNPVKALKNCLVEVKKELQGKVNFSNIRISLAATTGSSREILGVFLETPAVYNEIIAHAIGTTHFKPEVDTIFEIGGQDAKYVLLKNKVPIDYAMNEACSAGTGSFLEESAAGDLNIKQVEEIAPMALKASQPLKFGEHCSAFINSDIRKAIQFGSSKEDITAGIIISVVSNYLNRVVGNRTIGQNILLQGGVAKNEAIPLAFAMLLDKKITIPPDPELLGCYGVGLLAKEKWEQGLISKKEYKLDQILASEIVLEREFICQACDNYCPIRVLKINQNKYMFGGRCNKYANTRQKKTFAEGEVFNYLEKREELLFKIFAPPRDQFKKKRDYLVGVPKAFSVYTFWPFYSWFFHSLGIETRLSEEVSSEGITRVESAYCFPGEIAHGATYDIISKETDYIFIPHFRDLESYEDHGNANFCPITQALPHYLKKAFPEVESDRFLDPVISFKHGEQKALEPFLEIGKKLNIPLSEIELAFKVAYQKQQQFWQKYREVGQEAWQKAKEADHPVIALLGRPYNAFTKDANMGIPLKFTSRGYSIIPFDMIPFEEEKIFDNMYWYYGQQDMKASVKLKSEPNIYVTYITNFSCAPDSFILHYLKWIMGTKPFLILELDSHSADAGIDTRVEAFLDIIEGYQNKRISREEERYDNGLRFINNGKDPIHLYDLKQQKRIDIFKNPKVKMLFANMGQISTKLLAAAVKKSGISAVDLPLADVYTLQLARSKMSGKECLPAQLVLGGALKYLASKEYRQDEIYLLYVPSTTGPCRTGQYFVFFENLLRDLKLPNVVVVKVEADNSYNELGPGFTKRALWGLLIADYLKDIQTSLQTCAVEPKTAIDKYNNLWKDLTKEISNSSRMSKPLRGFSQEISKIPLKQKMVNTPKILIVGEIYVRRDDFAVEELVNLCSQKGIIAKVSGVAEWLFYCDYSRKYEILKRLKLLPWFKKIFSAEMKDLLAWQVERLYKRRVDHKVKKSLETTGLIPKTPHDMNKIMANANQNFVSSELESEISISSGAAYTAMLEGYSGIINISPFACLIGRVIEGILTPWARENNFPIMSVEVDGNVLPPNIINKLEIFMLNVLRFKDNKLN